MSRPSGPQLRYLRDLAARSGTTFTYPQTRAQASREIGRLRRLSSLTRSQRSIERRALYEDRDHLQPASSIREDEIEGYGSTATWAGPGEDQ